jgi:hypothetical protein
MFMSLFSHGIKKPLPQEIIKPSASKDYFVLITNNYKITDFSMKKLILILILFSAFFVQAQTNDEVYDDDGLDDSHLFETTSADPCQAPAIIGHAIVRYESSATAYLQFDDRTVERLSYRQQGDSDGATVTDNNSFVLYGLRLNTEYEIRGLNNCGDEVAYMTISTYRPDAALIKVSNRVFMATARFTDAETDIHSFMIQQEDLNYYEKLAFLQEYLYNNQEIPDDIREGDFPPSDFRGGADDNCNCKIIHYEDGSTGKTGTDLTTIPNPIPKTYWSNSCCSYFDGGFDKKGAAKVHFLNTRGKHISSREHILSNKKVNLMDSDNNVDNKDTPMFGELTYHYLCTNKTGAPNPDCKCEKEINLTARYDTRLKMAVQTLNWCTFCGSRGAHVEVEDHALLTYGTKDGTIHALDAGGTFVKGACGKEVNKEFWINTISIVGHAAQLFAGLKFDSQTKKDTAGVVATGITNLVDDIKNIIKTPPTTFWGGCETKELDNVLVDKKATLKLTPNNPIWVRLSSFSMIRAGGYSAWKSAGSIASNFDMAGMIYGGVPNNQDKTCCTDELANWSLASMPNAPWNIGQVKNEVGKFVGIFGATYDNTEAHYSTKKNCTVDGGGKISSNNVISTTWLSPMLPLSGEGVECSVFDTNGRLVSAENYAGSEQNERGIINQVSKQLENGVYLILIKSNTQCKTVKFAVVR